MLLGDANSLDLPLKKTSYRVWFTLANNKLHSKKNNKKNFLI